MFIKIPLLSTTDAPINDKFFLMVFSVTLYLIANSSMVLPELYKDKASSLL